MAKHVVITTADHVIDPLRPAMPHEIPIPGLSIKDPQPIRDQKHRKFMDSATEGVVVSIFAECGTNPH